jgi:RNA polymerase sigma factor (sigma-70 family)
MPVENRSDRVLVESARRGDKQAFGALVERHQAAAYRIALRMLPREEVVRELVQEALLEAYLSLERLRQPERFRSWLCGIVLNLCRGYLRDQKRHSASETASPTREATDWRRFENDLPDPEEMVAARELHRLVLAAIQELPPDQREATLLFYYEFLSLREIAAVAGVSVGAVKVRLYRARNQLRQRLVQKYPQIQPVTPTQERSVNMIRVRIADIIRQNGKSIVVLLDETGQRALPIWIGPFEVVAIALGVRNLSTLRPLTFNFIANLLEALGAELEEVRVEALREETFYGVAKMRIGDKVKEVDARPSDALALAAHTGSPIYVAEEVMEQAGRSIREGIQMQEGIKEMPPPSGEGFDAALEEVRAMLRDVPGEAGSAEE